MPVKTIGVCDRCGHEGEAKASLGSFMVIRKEKVKHLYFCYKFNLLYRKLLSDFDEYRDNQVDQFIREGK